MKILVTGTRGFLGAALVKHLRARHEVFTIPGRAEFRMQLVATPAVDWVIHAGFEVTFREDPEVEARNRATTDQLIAFFREGKGKNLLFLSAAGVMGVGKEPVPRGEERFGKTDPGFEGYRENSYVRGKMEAEASLRRAEIPLTVLYLTTVYGPGMQDETIRAARAGKLAPPGGSSYLALADFLAAVDLALAAPAKGEGYIVNGENLPFTDLYLAARGRKNFFTLPKTARFLFRMLSPFVGHSFLSLAILESAFGYKYYSSEKFRRAFSWEPKVSREKLFSFLSSGK